VSEVASTWARTGPRRCPLGGDRAHPGRRNNARNTGGTAAV